MFFHKVFLWSHIDVSILTSTNVNVNTFSLVTRADVVAFCSGVNQGSYVLGIVDELKQLESGRIFQLRSSNDGDAKEAFVKVFLVSACCDKPAQCLVQCLPEPTAKFVVDAR